VTVLLSDHAPWALANRAVIDLRRRPHSQSEQVSQVLLGEAVRILEAKGEWVRVRCERDGYLGWAQAISLLRVTQAQAESYQAACQARVIAELLPASLAPASQPGDHAGKLPFGVSLCIETEQDDAAQVRLPDGRTWWVARLGLLPFEQCPRPDAQGVTFTLDLMRRFIGIPYLWGGRSPYGFDCSGFAAAFWGFMGVTLRRDADQQFQDGIPVEGTPQPGDLLFFGQQNPDRPDGRFASISHVAISLGGEEVIHANSAASGVSINSLDPTSPIYYAWLHEHLAGVRRFA
jgi:hypothetical protein